MKTRQVGLSEGTIRYRDFGTGEPLLFVHGFPVNGAFWDDVAPELAKDFRCIVPDWPLGGHKLPMPPDADLSPPAIARLIVDFIDALELDGVTLIGNDTGGAFAQMVAADHPDRLARLVVMSSDVYEYFLPPLLRPAQILGHVPGAARALLFLLRFHMIQRLPVNFGYFWKKPFTKEQVDEYLRSPRENAAVRRDAKKVLLGSKPRYTLDAAEKLKRFEKPTLVVWATEDKLFPVEKGRQLAQSMPNARFEEVADSYAYIPNDQPERVIQLIRDFVRRPLTVADLRAQPKPVVERNL